MARKSNNPNNGILANDRLENAREEANYYRSQYEVLLKKYEELEERFKNFRDEANQAKDAEIEALKTAHKNELLDERMKRFLAENEKNRLKGEVSNLTTEVDRLKGILDAVAKDSDIAAKKIKQLQAKPFISPSERSDILNNRYNKEDKRGLEKENFDGTPESVQSEDKKADTPKTEKKHKKKSPGRMPPKENYDCNEVVIHPLDEYFKLPEGAKFKTRNGEIEIHEYVYYERIPERFIKHIFKTATYVTADGEAHNTLPEEERQNPIKGCPFSIEMLVFILVEKYAYHNCKNNIRRKLKEMGVNFSRSTFVRYYQLAEEILKEMYQDVLRSAVLEAVYMNIDETCEIVGVQDKNTLVTEYFKKYLWGFYNKELGLVQYLYDNGSRATAVLISYLQGYKGAFTSDGYVAYKYFDGNECPDVTHYSCNVHARRYFVDSLPFAYEESMSFIDDYVDIFHNEKLWKDLDPETRQKNRQRLTLPIFIRMQARADAMSKDERLMAIPAFKKAINYFRNQADTLRGFIFDGNAECSNNLIEQRFKTIKLDLKNCQVIGSEGAAENAAFMHSLVESCRLNNLNPTAYLTMLVGTVGKNLDAKAKRALLPDQWRPEG